MRVGATVRPHHAATDERQSPHAQAPLTSTSKEQPLAVKGAEKTEPKATTWYAALERPDWWLVIIAALTGLAICYQGREMTRATAVMREQSTTLRSTLEAMWQGSRAHLVTKPHGNCAQDLMSDNPRIQVELSNSGETPAYDATYETWIEILPFPFSDFTDGATRFKSKRRTLQPHGEPTVVRIPLKRSLTKEERAALQGFTLYACIRVRVEYRDSLRLHRYTEFGYYVQKNGLGFLPKYNDSN